MTKSKLASILILLSLGCASTENEPEGKPDALAYSDTQLPTDAYIAQRPDLAPPRDTLKTDTLSAPSSPDSKVALPPDVRVIDTLPSVVGQDTKPEVPHYVNDAGWSPDPTSKGACCLPCDSVYTGCQQLIQTTPWCNVTAGGTCYKGGKTDGVTPQTDSVWSSCLPLRADGKCDSAGLGS